MSGAVAKVNKPQLRGLLRKQIGINIAVATGLCFIAAVAQKFLYNDVRVQKYADFYKNYDINKEFEKMRKKGLFDSC